MVLFMGVEFCKGFVLGIYDKKLTNSILRFLKTMAIYYKVVEMYSNPDSEFEKGLFEQELSKWLNDGWTPVGGVCRSTMGPFVFMLSQALMKIMD